MTRRRNALRRVFPAAPAVALLIAGCRGSDRPALDVSAASSLDSALASYAHSFSRARVRLNLAGSDVLAQQIRNGVRPDVFAAANSQLPDELFRLRLVERPRAFATNRLVVAVPRGSARVHGVDDLAHAGVRIALGSPTVPVGAYARAALGRLDPALRAGILANLRSSEPDVAGVLGKLTQGAVDAGLVYLTDVQALGAKLRAIDLPRRARPRVVYEAAVVKRATHPRLARAFVAGLLGDRGRRALQRAGFGPAP